MNNLVFQKQDRDPLVSPFAAQWLLSKFPNERCPESARRLLESRTTCVGIPYLDGLASSLRMRIFSVVLDSCRSVDFDSEDAVNICHSQSSLSFKPNPRAQDTASEGISSTHTRDEERTLLRDCLHGWYESEAD
jgi:hypothetical protein